MCLQMFFTALKVAERSVSMVLIISYVLMVVSMEAFPSFMPNIRKIDAAISSAIIPNV